MYVVNQVKNFVSRTYFNNPPICERDYAKGRNLFILEGCCSSGVVALTTGAFLSGFASSMGADDSLNGIIGAIPTLLCVAQIFSSAVLENLKEKKFMIAILAFLHRCLLGLMFFVPFFVSGTKARLLVIIGMYALSHFCGTFIGTGACNWILLLAKGDRVGKYIGIRESFSLAVNMVLTLLMGRVLDNYRSMGKEYDGFLMIGMMVLALAFINFYCFTTIKEPESHRAGYKIRLKDVLLKPLKDKGFRKVILFYCLWNIALQVAGPFFSVYMVTGLKLNYTYIMVIGLLASLTRVFSSAIWGRLADRISWLWVTKCSMLILGITHMLWFFMTKETYLILQPILQVTSGFAWGGIAVSLFNLAYLYAPLESRVMYVGANAAYAGICGFLATLIGALLLKILPAVSDQSAQINGMQILFALSGVLVLGCALYVHHIMEKK